MRSTFTPTPYPPTLPPHTSNGGAQPPLPTPHTRKNGAAYGGAYLPTPRVARGKVCRWPHPWKRKATQQEICRADLIQTPHCVISDRTSMTSFDRPSSILN